jgi:hypothetical protein
LEAALGAAVMSWKPINGRLLFRSVDDVDDDPELLLNGFKFKKLWEIIHILHTSLRITRRDQENE